MVCDGALNRLSDPPRRIRRELVAASPVELLDGAVQPERALLNQVEEGNAEAAITLCDRDDEPQVRLDHLPLRDRVAALDALRQRDLLGCSQQLVLADIREEELQAVGRPGDLGRLEIEGGRGRLGLLAGARHADLEPDRLELAGQGLDLFVGEIVLEREHLELGREHVPALLGALEEDASLLALKQFLQRILAQLGPFVLSGYLSAAVRRWF